MGRIACRHLAGSLGLIALLFLETGCTGRESTFKWVLSDAGVALPEITGRERPVRRAGMPTEPLRIDSGPQTVLLACEIREDVPSDRPFWHRNAAYVIVLDGPVTTGTFEVTPGNGRFIENADWIPARRPYVGLEGRVKIVSVSAKGVVADCSVRNVISRTGDPVYPLRGLYMFRIDTVDHSILNRCAIDLGPIAAAPEGSE